MTESMPVFIRNAAEPDISFIFNSWLKSFRSGNLCRAVDNTIYYTEHHKVIEKLLKTSTVRMAVNPDKPEEIFGFICYEMVEGIFCLHYAYTKHTFRNLKILRQLMLDTGHNFESASIHSHFTDAFKRYALRYNLIYHPYILMNRKA